MTTEDPQSIQDKLEWLELENDSLERCVAGLQDALQDACKDLEGRLILNAVDQRHMQRRIDYWRKESDYWRKESDKWMWAFIVAGGLFLTAVVVALRLRQ